MLPDDAPLPLSLGDDLVKLAQLAHVSYLLFCCGFV